MADVPEITIVNGIPVSGTGSVKTISQITDRLGEITEPPPANDTASSALNGRLQRIAQRVTSLIALLPAALGSAAAAASFSVTQSTEDIARTGIITETAPATDTAASGLNGRLQRIAQRLSSAITLLTDLLTEAQDPNPAEVSLAVDDVLIGPVTETAPTTDTAASGLNGRLQRIAQRASSLIALLPTSIGTKAAASSLGVALSTEDVALLTAINNKTPAPDVLDLELAPIATAIAAGDVMAATVELANFFSTTSSKTEITGVVAQNLGDTGVSFELVFFNANTPFGTEDAAPDIDDTEALTLIGRIIVDSSDFSDYGLNRVADFDLDIAKLFKAAGSTSIWVAAMARGAETAGASYPIKLRVKKYPA